MQVWLRLDFTPTAQCVRATTDPRNIATFVRKGINALFNDE
jgi:hypothetical protein